MTVGSGGCSISEQENILDTNITVTNPTSTPTGIDYWIKFDCSLSGATPGNTTNGYSSIIFNENRTKVVNSKIIEMHIHYNCVLSTTPYTEFRKYSTSTLTYVSKVLPTLNGSNFYKARFELFGEYDATKAVPAIIPIMNTFLEIELTGSISSGVMSLDTSDAITKIQSLIATYNTMLLNYKPCYLVLKELVTN